MDCLKKIYHKQSNGAKNKSLSTAWAEMPELSLVLGSSPEVNGLKKNATVALSPGDAVHGRLDITCKRSFHVRRASIFLEGGQESSVVVFSFN